MIKLSLITVCYNSAEFIRTAMESVLTQTWQAIEYLVIDGGSADGTVEVIREYEAKFGGRMRWMSERDHGMYDAINKGIKMASGEVIGILNADDVLSDDDVIARVVEAFGMGESPAEARIAPRRERTADRAKGEFTRKGTQEQWREDGEAGGAGWQDSGALIGQPAHQASSLPVDVIYGDVRFVANRTDVGLDVLRAEKTLRYYSARYWFPWMLQWGFMPPHPSVYIRRACFDRLGYYELDYKIAADYAILIRFLRKAKLHCRYMPICFVDMRVGGMSTRNWWSNLLLNQEIVRGNREAGYFCCLPMLLPKYAFKVFEFIGPKVRRWAVGNRQPARENLGATQRAPRR